MTKRNILVTLLSIVLMISFLTPTAAAAANQSTETELSVYVNDQKIDATAYLGSDNTVRVYYSELIYIFPEETKTVFLPNTDQKTPLADWAETFGYSMSVTRTNVYLDKKYNTNPGSSANENRQAMSVYLEGKRISGVTVYKTNASTVMVNYADLYRLFPDETLQLGLPGADEEGSLGEWARILGYTMTIKTDGVYLTKNASSQPAPTRTAMSVYVSNKKVSGVTAHKAQDGTIYVSYADLAKIFTKETADILFPATTEETVLKEWATLFNYTMTVKNDGVYLTKNASTPTRTAMTVYLSNKKVSGVTAYKASDGTIYVGYSDLCKIFTKETANIKFPATTEEAVLKNWATLFGYTMTVKDSGVYLEKSTSSQPTPAPDAQKDLMKVYVNGMLIETTDVYAENGIVTVGTYQTLGKIFPKEWTTVSYTGIVNIPLETFAKLFGYSYVQTSTRVYLNNNKQKPLEIVVNGTILNFPDQQPIIINGRTMVPVRALSETLGWQVGYANSKVTITSQSHTIVLWIGSTTYTIDGVEKVLDVPAQIMNNRTMVPIRFISEAFGFKVDFNGKDAVNRVTLTK